MRRLNLGEINKYLGAEVKGQFRRADLKYEILIDIDESAFGYQENIDEKIDVIKKLDEIIDIVLFYRGDKEQKINSILSKSYNDYIEDQECEYFKKSLLILEIVEKRMRYHLMDEVFLE